MISAKNVKLYVLYRELRERLKKDQLKSVCNLFANILDGQLLRSHFVFLFDSLKDDKQQN